MNLYSVLLVDDEEEVYSVIMKKLDWEAMGFRIAGYARNGVEALEMAEEIQPDVVMTDIKMPYMDGLTLSKKLKELYQKIKIIIFSGFDEFEYAKEAIKIEAEEYILKPINSNELQEVFERIRTNLDRELDEKRNIEKLRAYYMESLPVLQENFYTSLIEGRIPASEIEKYLKQYQIPWSGPYYVATILHISTPDPQLELDPFLLGMSVKQLAEEQFVDKWRSNTFFYLGDILVITQLKETEEITAYTNAMDRFCKLAKRVCGAKVTAGIGPVCDEIAELPASYQGARNAVSYRVIYGNTRAINIAEIDPQGSAEEPWEEQSIGNILKKIKTGDEQALKEAVKESVTQLSGRGASLQKYQIFITELIAEIFRFGTLNGLNLDEIFSGTGDIYREVLQMESPEALENWLLKTGRQMQEMIQNGRQDTTKSFVTKAIEYVREHYADSGLNVESVCKNLSVSTAYFSTVFKKETGKTFINYLTEYRMEQALDLLLNQDEKTYVIAEKVGYSDPNYFSYAFKKQFGMSPSKYKAEKRK